MNKFLLIIFKFDMYGERTELENFYVIDSNEVNIDHHYIHKSTLKNPEIIILK